MRINHAFFSVLLVVFFLSISISCKKNDPVSDQITSETVTDIDGNVYHTVIIGTQVWMAENLKTTKYNDGVSIPNVTDNKIWESLVNPAYCWHNNDMGFKTPYGALYNWYTVNTGKLAPKGWHVPTDDEWTKLINYLGGTNVAGGKLKEAGTSHWLSPNTSATNETGFTAIPNSSRSYAGTFFAIGNGAQWWNTTEYNINNQVLAKFLKVGGSSGSILKGSGIKQQGFAVRCVKD